MGRYGFIPAGYKEHGEYLVNIETGKVWKTDKTIEELEGKVQSVEEAKESAPESVEIPKVQAKKVTKAIKRG